MRRHVIIAVLVFAGIQLFAQSRNRLWYEEPAREWVEALPIGNGKIGAMVFGTVDEELIQLNESTLWSGGPRKNKVNPEAYKYLQPVREALDNSDFEKAEELTRKMQGNYSESFLPLGDLNIKQTFKQGDDVSNYVRDLDIDSALSSVRFDRGGTTFTREFFTSAPDNVLAVRITSSQPKMLFLDIGLTNQLQGTIEPDDNRIAIAGKAPARVDPNYYNPEGREPIQWEDVDGCNGMRVYSILQVVSSDGTVMADTAGLHIEEATEVVLYLTTATSFNGFDKCPDKEGKDEKKLAESQLSAALAFDYDELKHRHVVDYKKLFDRVALHLERNKDHTFLARLPSDFRLKLYSYGNHDPELESFYFQYGRYLLISSSRPGGAAANLQGLWNKEFRAPWSSNYTININTQMNYWPAESGNLSELHEPLLGFIDNLSQTGKLTAQEYYKTRGWVAHHNSDIWALSNAVGDGEGDPLWANWYMGGAWLSQHLWEHYAYNGDVDFLREKAYPVMKEAALFCLDWLVEKDGYFITSPSTTPENQFTHDGKNVSVSEGTTMDMAIISDLFHNVIEASQVLKADKKLRDELTHKIEKLSPYKIGSQGQLLEWMEEYEEVDPHHRHLSHLFGLHPGKDISPLRTPALADAAAKTFELRGDEGTGWSKGWKINFAARLLDGDHAYKMVREILRYCEPNSQGVGGTYPNFFDAHPPFQIDGNFGATAGVIEMLMQSHLKEIHLLPALPKAWKAGSITGIKARGNFEVDITWDQGQLSSAKITSNQGQECVLRTSVPIRVAGVSMTAEEDGDYYRYRFNTLLGKEYRVEAL